MDNTAFKKKWDHLFSYWDSLPQMFVFEESAFKKISQKIRRSIVNCLMIGLQDESDTRRRHVLSAQEIKVAVETTLQEPLEKANLYFHLSELEQLGAIQIVDTLPISGKRRSVAYYGRTAKMFILNPPKGKTEFPLLYTPEFLNLLLRFNPEKTLDELKTDLNAIDRLNRFENKEVKAWFILNEGLISRENIDYAQLFEFLGFVNRMDLQTLQGLKIIASHLKFKP